MTLVAIAPDQFDDDYRKNVCKIGQGEECCRYLTIGAGGWACEKKTSLRHTLDHRVKQNQMVAKGDNCGGCFTPLPAFVLTADRFEHVAGTTVYRAKGYDYGLSADDEYATGIPHTSMTLDPSGDFPSFTVPNTDFEEKVLERS